MLEPSTVLALSLALIASVNIRFAVADGRPKVIAVECEVAGAFVVVAATAVTATAWILVLGFTAHGIRDAWQERSLYVANTRWWPPFYAAVDWLVAAILVVEDAAGVQLPLAVRHAVYPLTGAGMWNWVRPRRVPVGSSVIRTP